LFDNGQPQREGWSEEDRVTVTWLLPAPAKDNLRPGTGKTGHLQRERPFTVIGELAGLS
jgi:hypothetical protein